MKEKLEDTRMEMEYEQQVDFLKEQAREQEKRRQEAKREAEEGASASLSSRSFCSTGRVRLLFRPFSQGGEGTPEGETPAGSATMGLRTNEPVALQVAPAVYGGSMLTKFKFCSLVHEAFCPGFSQRSRAEARREALSTRLSAREFPPRNPP